MQRECAFMSHIMPRECAPSYHTMLGGRSLLRLHVEGENASHKHVVCVVAGGGVGDWSVPV